MCQCKFIYCSFFSTCYSVQNSCVQSEILGIKNMHWCRSHSSLRCLMCLGNVIMPAILFGCENLSEVLREECLRLRNSGGYLGLDERSN